MTRLRLLLPHVVLALACQAGAASPPQAPPFAAELAPLVGTWKRIKQEKKEPDLFLVIKEEQGLLRLRYQLPTRKKVYTSDWNGDIEIDLQVNMRETHDVDLRIVTAPPSIEVSERIHFSGTWKGPKPSLESTYELSKEGRLVYRCRRFTQDEKDYPCPKPIEYERISTGTTWPR